MKIEEIITEGAVAEGPKTRAAALAALVGAGGAGYLGTNDKAPEPAPIEKPAYTQQMEIPKPAAPAGVKTSIAGLKPNTHAVKEPVPFVPSEHTETLMKAAKQMGITDKNDLANFLAQCSVETFNWRKSTEQFTYSTPEVLRGAYTSRFPSMAAAELYLDSGEVAIANRALANKNGNGDETSGDGWRYRGRGFIHITGRDIYAKVGAGVHPENPDIYIKNPALLSTNPVESAKAAAWYFRHMVGKGKTAAQASLKVNPAGLKSAERIGATDYYKQALSRMKPAQTSKKR
jgi:putative chitinase